MRTLRRWSGDDSAPLIFVTSKSDPAEVGEGLAAGGVADLAEPFRKPAALARIRIHLLNRRRIAPRNKNDRAKNRLLCMAAHDLRNPPVSIRALAHLLRNGTVGDVTLQQRDVLDPVYDASDALLEPVDDLLDVSVLEARELPLTLAPPSVTTLVWASVKLTNPTAADQGSSIVWRPGPLPEALALDGAKVRQVLANLLDNAVNFSPPGSTITVETEWAASTAPSRSGTRVRESSTANASGSSRTSVARRPSPPAANRAPASASRSVTKSCRRAAGASAPTTDRRLAPRFASPLPWPYRSKVLVVDDEVHIRKFVPLLLQSLGEPVVLQAADAARPSISLPSKNRISSSSTSTSRTSTGPRHSASSSASIPRAPP